MAKHVQRSARAKSIAAIVGIVMLIAGLIRVSGIEIKFYWIDEVSSSFVITGHWPEFIESKVQNETGRIIRVGDFVSLLESQPNRDPIELIRSLSRDDPHHCPLYFLLAQSWASYAGASPVSLRTFATMIGVMSLAAFYWLCVELFSSSMAGLIGITVLALSPFHIIFSQQNREYGLWFLMTLVSTATLLAANRLKSRRLWAAYGVSVALGLYSFLFFAPFLLCHLIYQIARSRESSEPTLRRFLLSAGLGSLAFAPWAIGILMRLGKVEELNQWSSKPISISLYLQGFVLNVSRLFVDFDLQSFTVLPWTDPMRICAILATFSLVFYSLVYMARRSPRPLKWLLLSMFLVPLVLLVSMDLAKGGGIHALVGRYLVPTWISAYLCVAYTVSSGLLDSCIRRRMMASVTLLLILAAGAGFCARYIPSIHWWHLKPTALAVAAERVNSSGAELIILSSPMQTKHVLSLAYSLDRELSLLFLKDQERVPELARFRKVALYQPSTWLVSEIGRRLNLLNEGADLWLGSRQ